MGRDESWRAPPGPDVHLTRGHAEVDEVPPGHERIQFLQQLSTLMGIEAADVDRPFDEVTDGLGALECLSLAEAIWKVELGPRSGTVSEMGNLVTGYSTLRELIAAAESAAAERSRPR